MIDQYSQVALFVSLIEIHKLIYFLQEAGEDLKLRYRAKSYGPYADNLRHMLKSLEGHQLEGFGDGSKKVREAEPITVLPGGVKRGIRGPRRRITSSPSASCASLSWSRASSQPTDSSYSPAFTGSRPARGTTMT